MSALSAVLRGGEGGRLSFWCPGCDESHAIQVGAGPGPRWGWDGNIERPTFTPSVLVTTGHYVQGYDGGGCWCTFYREHPPAPGERVFACGQCHSFVRNGRIEFQADCTHALAGQTVDLPRWQEGKS